MNWLITSGGTKVKIDAVRHLGNMSSGRYGADLVKQVLALGPSHRVTLLMAKGSVDPRHVVVDVTTPIGLWFAQIRKHPLVDDALEGLANRLTVVEYSDFHDYAAKLQALVEKREHQIVMLAAAVSDYGMPNNEAANIKISSDEDELVLRLVRLPKLISKVKEWDPNATLVGFKLLVGSNTTIRHQAACKQMRGAGSDYVVVNDLDHIKHGNHMVEVYERNTQSRIEYTTADKLIATMWVNGRWVR